VTSAQTIAIAAALAACHNSEALPPPPTSPPPRASPGYLKGQLHVHTNNSGDSATPPAEVAQWYAAHHYDFIIITDHNFVTVLDPTTAAPPGLLVLPGIEITQNLETCVPPPQDPATNCLLHVNALVTTDTTSHGIRWTPPATPPERLATYTDALDFATKLGGIAQLNHPNFHWGADAAIMAALASRGLRLFEVANESTEIRNEGDATHPSTEALWDTVLTGGATLFGTATDDAHQYADADAMRASGHEPDVGDRGWVMVHAAREASAIRAALARGDFYASNGVELQRIDRTGDEWIIEAAGTDAVDTRFIGTGGRELARVHGRIARLPLRAALAGGGYARAVVTDARGHHAWVQPIR
jgi:hypothetical protein